MHALEALEPWIALTRTLVPATCALYAAEMPPTRIHARKAPAIATRAYALAWIDLEETQRSAIMGTLLVLLPTYPGMAGYQL